MREVTYSMNTCVDFMDTVVLSDVRKALLRMGEKVADVRCALSETLPSQAADTVKKMAVIANDYRKDPQNRFDLLEQYAIISPYNYLLFLDSDFLGLIHKACTPQFSSGDLYQIFSGLKSTSDEIEKTIKNINEVIKL
jgi:hypothetical protein